MKQELIEQYVAGQLGEAEAEAFEDYCVANPEFARLVEHEQRLRAGIAQVATGSTTEFVRTRDQRPWYLAIAAAVLAAILGVAYTWNHAPVAHGSPILAAVNHGGYEGKTLRLARLRGGNTTPVLERGLVRIEIVGLFDPEAHYTLALEKKSGAIVSRLDGQHPSSANSLEASIDADQLPPGAYTLRVNKQPSSEDVLEFEIVKPESVRQ